MDEDIARAAADALATGPRLTPAEASDAVPHAPGLYAVYGDASACAHLATGTPDRPLYVGKAEHSLAARDVRTHFATGRTGSSTLRRTLAALLRDHLALHAIPRNPARPDGSASFALEPGGDARLTEWMRARLCLAVWPGPEGVTLNEIETAVLTRLRPPLNLSKMGPSADPRLKAARSALSAEARAWRPGG
ncbi:GIY-YIG nuclease family protein [Streptomyces sp. NPDC088923]|uniref:GIY-YIG nuclease family protein n=1 Tax=Streptomyces sp. NPDC088923 TaxID=3365913 RepID=UPI0038256BA9